MVHEVTLLTIDPSRALAFESAVASCAPLFSEVSGCTAMRLERVLETFGRYHLRIEWETLEHHVVTFRASPTYAVWRSRVGPFFTAEPNVSHTERIAAYF